MTEQSRKYNHTLNDLIDWENKGDTPPVLTDLIEVVVMVPEIEVLALACRVSELEVALEEATIARNQLADLNATLIDKIARAEQIIENALQHA